MGAMPKPQAEVVLALDVGSSSVRGFLYDAAGRRVGGAPEPYAWRTTPDGGIEVEAALLLERTAAAVDGALRAARASGFVIAAGATSALWHSLLGVAEDGAALTPVYSWSDMRAAPDAAALRRELDAEAVHARTGAALHPSYLPARIRWARRSHPLGGQVRWWMSAAEWLELQLFGEPRVSVSMASGTGLLDQRRNGWDGEMLAATGIDAGALAPLTDLDEPRSGLAEPWRSRWPELATIPWLPAIGDGVAANVGSGCLDATRVALSVGTSAALRVLLREETPRIPPELWCYRLDRGRPVLGGAISNAGSVYRLLRALLRLPDDPAAIEAAVAALPPDGHGLTVLPFWSGERSPHWPLGATATLTGLTAHTTPIEILRAALEAVAYRLAYLRRRIRERFPASDTVVGSGSALAASPAWARILADVLGEPIVLVDEQEASSRGAALLALAGIGVLERAEDAPPAVARIVHPDPGRTRAYAAGYERHWALDAATPG